MFHLLWKELCKVHFLLVCFVYQNQLVYESYLGSRTVSLDFISIVVITYILQMLF